ncbi:MAG: DNA recombination protein RmuC [Terriglobia bacterium]
MSEWLLLAVGLALGGVVAWFWAKSRSVAELSRLQVEAEGRTRAAESTASELRAQLENLRRNLEEVQSRLRAEGEQRAGAEARLQEAQANLAEQKKLLDEAKQKLADTFNALAAEALKSNNQAFVALARSTFETIQAQAQGDLETRHQAIEGLVNPLREALGRYEKQIQEMERARQSAYGGLEQHLKILANEAEKLQQQTGSLASALKGGPQVRGRWGELTLRRVAELAGMSEHCDFTEQETLGGEGGRQRPDMIVNLPGGRRIAVDAKVPLQSFLDAASASNEKERGEHLQKHAQRVRNHMNQLAVRSYWEQFDPAPEMVVLFLPGESFFAAALEQDRSLIEDGMEKRVILATPTTLIALLRAVAYGWRQEQMEKNAQAVSELGKQLYDRVRTFLEHFEAVGNALHRSIENYNKAVGSLESRVLPSARKFKELGAATGNEIVGLEPIDETPRALAAPDRDSSG